MSIGTVAVITATFNAAVHLKDCIASVAAQSYCDLVHVIVDGLSTDNTADLVAASVSDKIVFTSERDTGIYSAWNKGISSVSADWYLFLGADDLLLPHAIQSLADLITNIDDVNLASGSCVLLNPDATYRTKMGSAYNRSLIWHHMPNANCATLYHRSLFDKAQNFDETYRSAADYLFLLQNRARIRSAHTNSVVSIMKAGGISNSNPRLSLKESLRARLTSYPTSLHLPILASYALSLAKISMFGL